MLNPADHSYQGIITGQHRQSVTTILAQEGYICKEHYREGRQDIGTQGHRLLDAFDKGWKFTAPQIYMRYLQPYQRFLESTGMKIIDSEVEIENPLLGYSGTMDKIALHPKDGYGIVDLKFSRCYYVAWMEYQTEFYRQGLIWLPKYKGLDIRWRGGIILSPDCDIAKFIPHNRIQGIEKICQAIAITNADKHLRGVHVPKIDKENGWIA